MMVGAEGLVRGRDALDDRLAPFGMLEGEELRAQLADAAPPPRAPARRSREAHDL